MSDGVVVVGGCLINLMRGGLGRRFGVRSRLTWPKLKADAAKNSEKTKKNLFISSLKAQSLSDLDAQPRAWVYLNCTPSLAGSERTRDARNTPK